MLIQTQIGDFTLPHSDATNAYDLLGDVIAAIREEPKRFDMNDWLSLPWHTTHMDEDHRPACGTVGCIAGWVVTLRADALSTLSMSRVARTAIQILIGPEPTGGYIQSDPDADDGDVFNGAEVEAYWAVERGLDRLFTRTSPTTQELAARGVQFGDGDYAVGTEENLALYERLHKPQTPEYAEMFIARIEAFRAAHADRLRARTF